LFGTLYLFYLASLKQLAGQTIWYGLSNIAAKFLNQLLTPIVTYILRTPSQMVDYGNISILYALMSFVNVIYTYGLETAYFRFSSGKDSTDTKPLFNTSFSSLLISSVFFSLLVILFRQPISDFIGLGGHTEYIIWCALIMTIDALAAIPFARLRQEGRPRKYAFVRVAGIAANMAFTIYFLAYCPSDVAEHPYSAFGKWYRSNTNVGFLLLANLAQSVLTFGLLYKEWLGFHFKIDKALWKKIIIYSSPMIIVGLGGMVNETIDRIMLPKLYAGSLDPKIAVGIYGANYKIAIAITLFIQAFKMSAEPFFFNQSGDKNAPKTYARVMKWFVIMLCLAFLFTALYIDLWKYFVGPQYRQGLAVVPILLAANVALGIYYNLSVWYKITDKMYMGMIITLIGAAITLAINFAFIPQYGMYACAWATLAAYASMMVISYFTGQHFFPVPYSTRKLLSYLAVMLALFFVQKGVMHFTQIMIIRLITGTVLLYLFVMLVIKAERKELAGMPVVGKWVK
jgi:O-antigen/teichoic acid export membrane protein